MSEPSSTPEPMLIPVGRFDPEQAQPAPSGRPQCRALTADGHRCKNFVLGGLHLCYSHYRNRRPALPAPERVSVPLLEDRSAIQLVATQIVHGILSNRVDYRRARTAVYALQVAAHTVTRPPRPRIAEPEPPVESVASLARDYEDFISADGDLTAPALNPSCSVPKSVEAVDEMIRTFEPRNRCHPELATPDMVIPDPSHDSEKCPCHTCADYRRDIEILTAKIASGEPR